MADAAGAATPGMALAEFGIPMPGPPAAGAPSVLLVGNFDGVHLGHQRLLTAAKSLASRGGAGVLAVTFEPHPQAFLHPDSPPTLLTPLRMRRQLLSDYGADVVIVVPFDLHLRDLSPGEFLDRLRARHRLVGMVAGPTLSIGRGGEGRLDFVAEYMRTAGLELTVIAPVVLKGREISSSAVRDRLEAADLDGVAAMTGRRFSVLGEVEAGDGRGRTLGFPTANLHLHQSQLLPPDGVYVMRLRAHGAGWLPAVGSVGTRPQYGPGDRKFEVHCLVEPGDLYGQQVEVEVVQILRGQEVFESESGLVSQMRRDGALAVARLATEVPGTGPLAAGEH